jgi:branched-chain amino acid transport system permease protein
MDNFANLFLVKGIIIGSIYALISLGFNVIYNTTGVINFAQGEFVMVGGVASAGAVELLHWPLWLGLIFGALVAAFVGVLLDVLAIRPARKASPITLIIITIGASIVIRAITSLVGKKTEAYNLPVFKEGFVKIAGVNVDYQSLLVVAVAASCMLLLTIFFRYTTTGRAMKACAENREAARLCGVSASRMSTIAFGVSAMLGGIGGMMVTPILSMRFDQGTMLGLKGFSAAILGGIGNPVGGVVGGVLIGILEQYGCVISSVYKDTLALAIVVIILLIRPKGLLSR